MQPFVRHLEPRLMLDALVGAGTGDRDSAVPSTTQDPAAKGGPLDTVANLQLVLDEQASNRVRISTTQRFV